MHCIGCAARHLMMQFYPDGFNKRAYANGVAQKYGHDVNELLEKVRELKNEKTNTTGNLF